jgi:dTDP-4-amino-4,6-dideoxygalactose transaminase
MHVPFLDLKLHHEPIRAEALAAIAEVVDSGAFAGGPYVAKFEEDFARFCETSCAVGVGNGTDALWLALLALGVGHGDEVITIPATFIATAEAITYTGAKPVFVDIEERTCTLDPNRLEAAITPRTKAIIPVHLFGQMADMDPILEIAARHNLPVIEDAAQAHGARYKGRAAGSMGRAGCFSFYPGKNLGAFGEAGAVVTHDEELKRKIEMFRDHGQSRKYVHQYVGWNARMDGIQGAVLRIKLRHLDANNEKRRANARIYEELLNGIPGLVLPTEAADRCHVHHLYAIRVPNRDQVLTELNKAGIGCGIHYPVPLHLQEAYAGLNQGPGSFPVAERCAGEFLSLPMFPELTRAQIERVAETVKAVMSDR